MADATEAHVTTTRVTRVRISGITPPQIRAVKETGCSLAGRYGRTKGRKETRVSPSTNGADFQMDHESAMLAYASLAEVSQRKRQLMGRDKLLVLAAAAACRAGWLEVGERCRELVLEHNPAHLIGSYPTAADALRSADFAPLLAQLERLCGYERAEFLVSELGISGRSLEDDRDAGQIALSLLGDSPNEQD